MGKDDKDRIGGKMTKMKKIVIIFILIMVFCFSIILYRGIYGSASNRKLEKRNSFIAVGATYYGGYYDSYSHKWVVDNIDECSKIKNQEFLISNINILMDKECDDDNGIGFLDSTELHNSVSYAELSINPEVSDWSALGGLPIGTKLELSYKNKCLVAEKLDVGSGGGPIKKHPRAIDLWWQTARTLEFKNGYDLLRIRYVNKDTPLSKLGASYAC